MTSFVIDTNVGVVANEGHPEASPECVTACTNFLEGIVKGEALVVIDTEWEILEEYLRYMSSSGQPGPGDAFLKWLLNNLANPERCEQVWIDHVIDPENDRVYEQFPDDPELAAFDRSDRKFAAVALASSQMPLIANAVDSDWWKFREALERVGVRIEFLCGDQVARWGGPTNRAQRRSSHQGS